MGILTSLFGGGCSCSPISKCQCHMSMYYNQLQGQQGASGLPYYIDLQGSLGQAIPNARTILQGLPRCAERIKEANRRLKEVLEEDLAWKVV